MNSNDQNSPSQSKGMESIFDKPNDFVPENAERSYSLTLSEVELSTIANSLADGIARSWLFDPKGTINEDVMASYGVLKLLKKVNSQLSPDKRIGCVAEKFLPFEGGDIYINAVYRLATTLKGKVIAIATFSFDKDLIAFRLFDPVRYPNAQKLADCLGDKVPLGDIQSIEEVSRLTEQEMEGFSQAIKNAWCTHY